jgi:hypothetical protein
MGIAEKTSSSMLRAVSSGLEEALMLGLVWGDCDSSAQGDTVQGDAVHRGSSLADDAVVALSVDEPWGRENARFASDDCLANEFEVASRCCCSVAALGLLGLAAGWVATCSHGSVSSGCCADACSLSLGWSHCFSLYLPVPAV